MVCSIVTCNEDGYSNEAGLMFCKKHMRNHNGPPFDKKTIYYKDGFFHTTGL